jgi:hypothetical protein
MKQSSEVPDFFDQREFSLVDYRHGHGYAVIRGFPVESEDNADSVMELPVLDICFSGIERISCWKDIGPIHFRRAAQGERDLLAQRIGKIRRDSPVFLLEDGSVESHVICSRAFWAEYKLPFGCQSPLVTDDEEYRATYPPVGDVVRYSP